MTMSKSRWSLLLAIGVLVASAALAIQPRSLYAQSTIVDGSGSGDPGGGIAGDPDNPTDGKSITSPRIGSGSAMSAGSGSVSGHDLKLMRSSRSTNVAPASQPALVNSRLWALIWAIRSYMGW